MSDAQDIVGPILLLDDIAGDRMQIAALFIVYGDAVPPPVCTDDVEVTPQRLASNCYATSQHDHDDYGCWNALGRLVWI